MIRFIVWTALFVWSVANVRWPVSAIRRARLHRLEVAHLADEDDVGVLAEDRAERVRERVRVGVQLALVDDAALVGVEELDRVLDRDDVLGPARG